MKTTWMSRGGWTGLLLLTLTATGSGIPAPASAQDVERTECRCVDAEGNEIENCTCLRMPRMEGMDTRLEAIMPRLEGLGPRIAVFRDGRPRLGISIRVDEPSSTDAEGAVVEDVLPEGPADEAGIQAGDVITHLDGRALTEPASPEVEEDLDLDASVPAQRLLALAGELEPGQEVEVQYLRDGRPRSTVVRARDLSGAWGAGLGGLDMDALRESMERLGEGARAWRFRDGPDEIRLRVAPEGFRFRGDEGVRGDVHVLGGPGSRFFFGGEGHAAGLELVEVNPALGEYFQVDGGVLVSDVAPSSTLGLEPGDVVLAVDGREVETPRRLRTILASYDDDEQIELRIVRNGEERRVTAPVRQ